VAGADPLRGNSLQVGYHDDPPMPCYDVPSTMLTPELLRTLMLPAAGDATPSRWLSAASGLVHAKGRLYVIADDAHHLFHVAFDVNRPHETASPLQAVRLLPGELPTAPKARKEAKPDLESVLLLPATAAAPEGRLLCLGSGGKANRRRALEMPLRNDGDVAADAVVVHDLTAFFSPLQAEFADLNIEGAFLSDSTLTLLQRGNKATVARSACLCFDADQWLGWLAGSRRRVPTLKAVHPLDFGQVAGVPLCPTDATLLADGYWVVTLVAEDTDDSVKDGHCVASALAVMTPEHELGALYRLQGNPKVEGVALANPGDDHALSLLLVTDADDPAQPSQLLRVDLPARQGIVAPHAVHSTAGASKSGR
jgi:hypothetical protein